MYASRNRFFWRLISAEGPLIWMLPMVLLLGLFYLYPLLDVIRLSFTDASLVGGTTNYTLKSFRRIAVDPSVMNSLRVTLIFTFSNVAVQLTLGLVLALAIHAGLQRRLKGTILVRTSVLAAWIIPSVVVGILWRMILTTSNYGIVNYFLSVLMGERIPFLISPDYALPSVIATSIWRGTAFSMILQYAGLQRILEELYEAARVDGASAVQQLHYITIPQLRPILFVNIVLTSISSFKAFDMILALTGGGPARMTEVLSISAYKQVFNFYNLGRGSALAVVILLINLTMTLIYYRTAGADEEVV